MTLDGGLRPREPLAGEPPFASSEQHRTLYRAPSLPLLYLRSLWRALPSAGDGQLKAEQAPATVLTLGEITAEPRALARYRELCGFADDARLPGTYPQLLAFPLVLSLLSGRELPFSALALVHGASSIRVHRPLGEHEPLELSVRTTPLQHELDGARFAILTEARTRGELVWCAEDTMLRPRSRAAARASPPPALCRSPDAGAVKVWTLPGNLGRRYAKLSGDRNPIHLYRLSARPFGLPRPVAHSTWLAARALAALSPPPEAYTLDLSFHAPLALPARAIFTHALGEQGRSFALRGAESPPSLHMCGSLGA